MEPRSANCAQAFGRAAARRGCRAKPCGSNDATFVGLMRKNSFPSSVRSCTLVPTPLEIQQNIPLAPLTTLRVGGPARYFVEAHTEHDVHFAEIGRAHV